MCQLLQVFLPENMRARLSGGKATLARFVIVFFLLWTGATSIRAAESVGTVYGVDVFVPPGLPHPWGLVSGPSDVIELQGVLDANDALDLDNTYFEAWQVTFQYDSRVDIRLDSREIDPYLVLIRIDSTQQFIDVLEDDDSGPGQNARITTDIQAGTYWVIVNSFDAFETGAWSLAIQSSTNSRDSSFQMVPTRYGVSVQENPNPYILGELRSGDFVYDSRFVDIYQFEVSNDVPLQIDLTSNQFDTRLMLANVLQDGSLGSLFILDEDGGESTNSRIMRSFEPGTYFMVASSGAAGGSGEYEISVSVSVGNSGNPGGDLGACRAGLIVDPGESCVYNGRNFTVDSSGRGSIAFFSAGSSIDARGSTINGVLWNFHASKNSGSNSWTIHVADGGDNTGGADDHGDNRASATQVTVGVDVQGALTAGDTDYFRLDLESSGTLEVYTSGSIDSFGRLEDADGVLVDSDDDGGAGLNFRLETNVNSGAYFVRVTGFDDDDTGDYTLHSRFTPGDGGGGVSGACRAGLVVNPGEICTYKGYDFTVDSSGRGSIAFFSAGSSIDARGSTINGVLWNFHASKNSGSNSWTIHVAD